MVLFSYLIKFMVGRANLAVVLRSKWVRRLSMAVATLLKFRKLYFVYIKNLKDFYLGKIFVKWEFVKRRNGCQSISQWSPLNLALRHQLEYFLN